MICVYKITCLINNKFYIGSTIDYNSRKKHHIRELRNIKHCNKSMQLDYIMYGEKNFIFEVLLKSPQEYIIQLENWFIRNLNPEYNELKEAFYNVSTRPITRGYWKKVLDDQKKFTTEAGIMIAKYIEQCEKL